MELNYDSIEKFITNNSPPKYQKFLIYLTKKKFLSKYVDNITESLIFEFILWA